MLTEQINGFIKYCKVPGFKGKSNLTWVCRTCPDMQCRFALASLPILKRVFSSSKWWF
jgi:hypothetical protein